MVCFLTQSPLAVAQQEQKPPNFLFVFVDDQPWNGTSVPMIPGNEFSRTPHYRMPNLEGIASGGMVFSQAYASHPKCECSRAALLMGRTTTSLNAVDKRARDWSAPAGDSLANSLKRANNAYRAAHFGKWQWHQSPESMGYDASDGITMNSDGDSSDPMDPKQTFGITNRAKAYMENQVRSGNPFYLQLSYYAPHSKPQALDSTLKKYQSMNTSDRNTRGNSAAIMAAMTEDLDTCIGSLISKLHELDIAKNTYIIYMSDNGGNTNVLKGGKGLVDEGGVRVPLIVSGPGVKAGSYCHVPVVGYDLLATVLDLAAPGTKLPLGVEGGSWKPVLLNEGVGAVSRPIDRLVFHHDVEVPHPQTAMRKGDLKLVFYWDTKETFLYDLSKDLGEKDNLAKQRPELTASMLDELRAHVRGGLGDQKVRSLLSGSVRNQQEANRRGRSEQKQRPPDANTLQSLSLPDTGQSNRFTQSFGEDSDYTGREPSYKDNGDETISDAVTGLVWQKSDGGEMTWEQAQVYAKELRLGGYSDWRLPNSIELFSIMDHGKHGPAMNTDYFTRSEARYWWTNSTRADDKSKVWVVNTGGGIGAHAKSETISAGGDRPMHVRCVRGESPFSSGPNLQDNQDGTVSDLRTGLVWQKVSSPEGMDWESALQHCSNLKSTGKGDWRLPNIKELRSLSDDLRTSPSVDPSFFDGVQAKPYWSSTTQSNRPERAWYVDFATGLVTYADKTQQYRVLAVRDGISVEGPREKPAVEYKPQASSNSQRQGKGRENRKPQRQAPPRRDKDSEG
jgi:arylsulfatase A-like enzyme